ncbi:outer membrane beta-barrel protein [Aquirufa rosea]|uniref:outer membrane beta-barrel protein n=1 Tax=Aquirufa rosea TaxID=2509241 RepID=UPI0013E93FEC|nr:outer membrane beta-barrel protein [Aquirufa rosea]
MKRLLVFLGFTFPILGQQDSTKKSALHLYAYAEAYYLLAPSNTSPYLKDPIFFNHSQANQVDLNLGILGMAIKKGPINVQVSGMLGTYALRNYAHEPLIWRKIYEMNITYQLAKKWSMLVGIFPSHIGFESAKNAENWTLSRSFVAENSPYFESGIGFYFKPNPAWTYSLFALRGWQQIQAFRPALGTQIVHQAANSWTWNSSGFIGDEGNGLRLFHDFYVLVPLSKNLTAILISDIGYQKDFWHGEALMIQAILSDKWKVAGRIEQFSDEKSILLNPQNAIQSASIGVNFSPFPKILLRTEWRVLQANNQKSDVHSPEYLFALVLGK